jgi:hypothetical protein
MKQKNRKLLNVFVKLIVQSPKSCPIFVTHFCIIVSIFFILQTKKCDKNDKEFPEKKDKQSTETYSK